MNHTSIDIEKMIALGKAILDAQPELEVPYSPEFQVEGKPITGLVPDAEAFRNVQRYVLGGINTFLSRVWAEGPVEHFKVYFESCYTSTYEEVESILGVKEVPVFRALMLEFKDIQF